MSVDRLLGVTMAVRREAIRRDAGESRDPRFDVPIAMLLDLADELFGPVPPARPVAGEGRDAEVPAPVDGLLVGDCTNDAACEADAHIVTCPRRR